MLTLKDENGNEIDIEYIENLKLESEKLKKELEKVKADRDRYFKIHADSQHEAMEYALKYAEVNRAINEARSQEPVAIKECGRWAGLDGLHAMPNGSRLYAAPVPAQQSPAVAVPDNGLEIAADYIDNIGDKLEQKWDEYRETSTGGCATSFHTLYHELADEIRSLRPSPRITEQDAQELLIAFSEYYGDCRSHDAAEVFLNDRGRALLNKLNANAVTDVKVDSAPNQEFADAIMGFAGDFIGAYLSGFIDTPLTNIAQIYQVARNHVKDSYGIETKTLIDVIGKDDFELCYVPVPVPSQAAAIPEGFAVFKIESVKSAMAECFDDGYRSPSTYNDIDMNDQLWIDNEREDCAQEVMKKLLSETPKPD